MAMGRRKPRQKSLFVPTEKLVRSQGHPFYRKLNELLSEGGFDRWIESRCEQYYEREEKRGQPSLPPGVYFRMLLIGYFEGIGSQRGIAWRCSDSRSLAEFLGYGPDEGTPDHSTMSLTRARLPSEVFEAVFERVLKIAADKGLIGGKTVGVDSTTLEANAAMKSIQRRDTGEDWREYVVRLMREEGAVKADENPSDEDVRRFDKDRKDKTVSNKDWVAPNDPDARITQMKDGRTHLAYKAEHVVDLEHEIVLAAEILPADQGDAQTLVDSVVAAQENLKQAKINVEIEEVAADKGYHSTATIEFSDHLGIRTYISEPKSKHKRKWTEKPSEFQRAVFENRRRMRRAKGKRLGRLRSERVERSFAHVCDTGGMRRTWLTGTIDVTKRYVIAVAAHNLGRIMRKLFGMGKPRVLQGFSALVLFVYLLVRAFRMALINSIERQHAFLDRCALRAPWAALR
jgi:transposase